MLPAFILVFILIKYQQNRSGKWLVYLSLSASLGLVWSHEFLYLILGTFLSILLIGFLAKNNFLEVLKKIFLFAFMTFILLILQLSPFKLVSNYLDQFRTNSSGYFFAWGMSFQWGLGLIYLILFFAVPILLFIYLSTTLSLVGSQNPKAASYTPLLPIAIAALLFYFKFLNWADWHLSQPTNLLLILLVFWASVTFSVAKFQIFGLATSLLIVFTVLTSFTAGIGDLQYRPSSNYSSTIGFMDLPTSSYESRVNAVRSTFKKYIGSESNTPILDFGNEPLTWFGVSKFRPAAGIDKVLNIASSSSQNTVITKLESDMPKAVIWSGEFGYWDSLFNGTWMRQYELTHFILSNYEPVASEGRYVLMMRDKKNMLDVDAKNLMLVDKCDWALGAPKFISPGNFQTMISMSNQDFITSTKDQNTSNFVTNDSFSYGGFAVESNKDTQITMSGVGSTKGKIIFTVRKSMRPQVVWLGGCAAWYYQHANSQWNIDFGDAKVKLLPIRSPNE